jgi:hypothetical protein
LLKLCKRWTGREPYLKAKRKGEKDILSTQLCITERENEIRHKSDTVRLIVHPLMMILKLRIKYIKIPSISVHRFYHQLSVWITIHRIYLLCTSGHLPKTTFLTIFYTHRSFILLFYLRILPKTIAYLNCGAI